MAHTATEFDEEKARDCKEDMDTLLVFVSDGLPSSPYRFYFEAKMLTMYNFRLVYFQLS